MGLNRLIPNEALPKGSELPNRNPKREDESKDAEHDLRRGQISATPNQHNESRQHESNDVNHRCTFNQHFVWTHELNSGVVDVDLLRGVIVLVQSIAPPAIVAPAFATFPNPPCCWTWLPIMPPIKLPKKPDCC